MKSSARAWWVAVGMVLASAAWAGEDAADPALDQARQAAGELGRTLRARLMEAVQQGGLTGAVAVCQIEAPALAAEQSRKHGAKVGRIGVRARNVANAPDPWEAAALDQLRAQLAAGVASAQAEYTEVVAAPEGVRALRYAKAIVTEPLCLGCHGEALDPALQVELDRRYPQDTAVGFKAGELRGAFTVTLLLP